MDVASTPGGGFVAAIIGPGDNAGSGRLLLIGCDRLTCPQPTVRPVRDVPLPGTWQTGGTVAIAADPLSGNIALGFFDRTDGSLWLGGCPAGCTDVPLLTRVSTWPEYADDERVPMLPSVHAVATTTGPAAVLGTNSLENGTKFGVPPTAAIIVCDDLACTTSEDVWNSGFATAILATDSDGTVYVIGSDPSGTHILHGPVRDGRLSELAMVTGDVVAAAFGPDDRMRLILDDDKGPALVTQGR